MSPAALGLIAIAAILGVLRYATIGGGDDPPPSFPSQQLPAETPDELRDRVAAVPGTETFVVKASDPSLFRFGQDTCSIAITRMPLDDEEMFQLAIGAGRATGTPLVLWGARVAEVMTDQFCPEVPSLLPGVVRALHARYGEDIPQIETAEAGLGMELT